MATYSFASLNDVIRADVNKEYSGNWTLTIRCVQETNPNITEGDIITHDGEEFRVSTPEVVREFENKYIDIETRHVFFDLESIYVVPGKVAAEPSVFGPDWVTEHNFRGTIEEHINNLLQFDTENVFALELVEGIDLEKEMSIEIEQASILENLNKILQYFNAKVILGEGTTPYDIVIKNHDFAEVLEGVKCEYAKNNINMRREYHSEDIIDKLYARAQVLYYSNDDPRNEDLVKEYGSGRKEGFIDYGAVDYEEDLDDLANSFLDIRSNPPPRYIVDVAEIKKLDENHPDYEPWTFDVAKAIQVEDPELGINEEMVIMGYSYSLLDNEDGATSNLELGTIEREYLTRDFDYGFSMRKRYDVIRWAEILMEHINSKILGGDISDIDSDIINYTPTETLVGEQRKTLTEAVGAVVDLVNDTATKDTSEYKIYDPMPRINGSYLITLGQARKYIERYIESTVKNEINTLVTDINNAYQSAIETGTVESQSSNLYYDAATVFADENFDTQEILAANHVFSKLENKIGNPSDVYTEISGRNGIVDDINSLYSEIKSVSVIKDSGEVGGGMEKKNIMPRLFVSANDPDDTKGSDGDLWFKYEEGEA